MRYVADDPKVKNDFSSRVKAQGKHGVFGAQQNQINSGGIEEEKNEDGANNLDKGIDFSSLGQSNSNMSSITPKSAVSSQKYSKHQNEPLFNDRYQLRKELGKGKYGKVFLARDCR